MFEFSSYVPFQRPPRVRRGEEARSVRTPAGAAAPPHLLPPPPGGIHQRLQPPDPDASVELVHHGQAGESEPFLGFFTVSDQVRSGESANFPSTIFRYNNINVMLEMTRDKVSVLQIISPHMPPSIPMNHTQ